MSLRHNPRSTHKEHHCTSGSGNREPAIHSTSNEGPKLPEKAAELILDWLLVVANAMHAQLRVVKGCLQVRESDRFEEAFLCDRSGEVDRLTVDPDGDGCPESGLRKEILEDFRRRGARLDFAGRSVGKGDTDDIHGCRGITKDRSAKRKS